MALLISLGNINDLISASKEGVAINIFKKNFNEQIIKSIKLVDSMIAQSTFVKASIYASSFTNCTFVNCDFSEADLYGIRFENCKFNECNFTKSKLDSVQFIENTILNNCNFNGADLANPETIIGLNDKDVNIIHEQNEEIVPEYVSKFGFKFDNQGSYILKNDNITYVALYFDPDIRKYRETLFIDNDAFLTMDLKSSFDKMDESYLKSEIMDLLSSSISKLNRQSSNKEINNSKEKINSITNLIKIFEENK